MPSGWECPECRVDLKFSGGALLCPKCDKWFAIIDCLAKEKKLMKVVVFNQQPGEEYFNKDITEIEVENFCVKDIVKEMKAKNWLFAPNDHENPSRPIVVRQFFAITDSNRFRNGIFFKTDGNGEVI